MSWRILSVGVYSKKTGELRDIEFKPSGLSIITGPSSRGKSSLLDIVDYCLLSERCPIAKGFIRDTVSHVGILIIGEQESLTIVRPLPAEGKLTSSVVHISKGRGKRLPSIPPDARWNLESAKELLSDFTGIDSIPVLTNDTDPSPEARTPANIRHCSFYSFQQQDVIASRNVVFSGLEDAYKRRHACDAAYYFLGILTIERLRKRRELRRLRAERNSIEKNRRARGLLKEEGFAHGLRLWSEAVGLKITQDIKEPSALSGLLSSLKSISDFKIDSLDKITDEMGLTAAQSEEASIRNQLRQKERDLANLERFGQSTDENDVLTRKQLERLDLRDLLPKAGEYSCPICRNESVDVSTIEQLILSATNELKAVREPPRRLSGKIEQERQRLRIEIEKLNESQAALHARLRILFTDWEKNRPLFEEASRREQLVGRIKEYLVSMRRMESPTDTKLDKLIGRINELESEVGDKSISRLKASIEDELSKKMTALAQYLDVEFRGAPIRIDFSSFLLEVHIDQQWVALNELGSGANWLGYHVASTVALHTFFREIQAPVPALLMLDQPSQAWFPAEKAMLTGEKQPSSDKELGAVRNVYKLIYNQSRAANGPQVIVVDHARLEDEWFRNCIVEDWHEGGALVPLSWR